MRIKADGIAMLIGLIATAITIPVVHTINANAKPEIAQHEVVDDLIVSEHKITVGICRVAFQNIPEIQTELTVVPNQAAVSTKSKKTKKTKKKDPDVSPVKINEEDLEMLAHLIGGEAGADYCDYEMKYWVGAVVLNRVNSKYFPDTIKDVIFQKRQYACTWDGNYDKKPSKECYKVARDLLENGVQDVPANVVWQSAVEQGDGVWRRKETKYYKCLFCYSNF